MCTVRRNRIGCLLFKFNGHFFCAIVTVIVAKKRINAMHAIWFDSFNLELWADLVVAVVVVLRIQYDDVDANLCVCVCLCSAMPIDIKLILFIYAG